MGLPELVIHHFLCRSYRTTLEAHHRPTDPLGLSPHRDVWLLELQQLRTDHLAAKGVHPLHIFRGSTGVD